MDKLVKLSEKNSNFQFYFFIVIFIGVLLLVYFVLKPFIFPFILAIIFAALFHPLYLAVLHFFNNKTLSSLVTVVLILLLILIPLSLLGIKIITETSQLYTNLSTNGSEFLKNIKDFNQDLIQKIYSLFNLNNQAEILTFDLNTYLSQGANWLLANLKSLFSSFSLLLFKAFIFLAMLYYLFKYGEFFKKVVIKFSPLPYTEEKKIFYRLNQAIHSILRGSIIIALIQGLLVGIGFSIFSVPQPALWGSVAAVAALIPSVGTAIVLIPAILFLWFGGLVLPAIGLLIWGIVAVGLIDNFLSPILISRNSNIHPFLIFLAVLGGIAFWGPIGFVLGPLCLSLLFALFEIYFREAEI